MTRLNRLFGILLTTFFIITTSIQTEAAPKANGSKSDAYEKERLVLMPLRVVEEDKILQGVMETAVVEGLEQKYEVFAGERVRKKVKEAFKRESEQTSQDHECDATKCMQDIAIAFQAELIAVANVTKQRDGYFVAISIQNIMDEKVVYSKSLPCEGCNAYKVVDKLKVLAGTVDSIAAASHPVAEPSGLKINQSDTEVILSAEPQAAAGREEQSAWDAAQQDSSKDSYTHFLNDYPSGRFAALAKVRLDKLEKEMASSEEVELWKKVDASNDKQAVESYLNKYPSGRYVAMASAKLTAMQEEETKGPEMVRIPGKNYEMGKYHITRGEFARFVSETGYKTGNECWIWTDKWEKKAGFNWRNPGFNQADNHPVTCVSWDEAQAYIAWLSKKTGRQYRLPTEAEWEYACNAGGQAKYCGGNNIDAVAWYKGNSNNATHPVGQKQANGLGLYDMSGNVWDWMQNLYDSSLPYRSLRGGSWDSYQQGARASYRLGYMPSDRGNAGGFRLIRMLP